MSMFYELMMKKKGMPSRYQEVEYIENITEEYGAFINTGYKANNNTRLVVKCSLNTSAFSATGGHQLAGSDNQSTTMFGVGTVTASQNYRFQYGSQITAIGTMVADTPTIFDLNKNKCYIDNNLVHTFTEETFNCLQNTLLFHRALDSRWSYWVGKIYYCQIYDNNRLVRNFIPVYDTLTNKYGMWESVQGKFYGNDGTGDFTGSIVGYTIVGSPTIVDGVVSGFSSANYLTLPDVDFSSNFESQVAFKINTYSPCGIFCLNSYDYKGWHCIGSNILAFSLHITNGSDTKFARLQFSVSTNTDYVANAKRNGNNVVCSLYSNGTLVSQQTLTIDEGYSIIEGVGYNIGKNAVGYFDGSIDLNETYIKVNNKLWFNGQQA